MQTRRVVEVGRSFVPMQPVRLGGLSRTERALAGVTLVIAAVWCGLFAAAAAGWTPGTPANWGWMGSSVTAAVVRVVTYGSLGLAGVLGVRAALAWNSWMRRGVLLLIGVALFYMVNGSGDRLKVVTHTDGSFTYTTIHHGITLTLTRVLGATGKLSALILVVLPLTATWQRRAAVSLVVLAATIPVVDLALIGQLAHPWHAMVDLRSDALWSLMMSLQIFFVLYLFWSLIAWAKLVGQWSAATGELLERGGKILVAAVVAKLAGDIAGLAGVLPSFFGGSAHSWVASRHDGWASWVTAAVLAGLGAAWLWRRPDRRAATPDRPDDAAHRNDPAPATQLPATDHLLLFAALLCAPAVVAAFLQMRPTVTKVPLMVIAGAAVLAMVAAWSAAAGRAYRGVLAVGGGVLVVAVAYSDRLSLAPNQVTGNYLLAPLAAFLIAAWVCWREGCRPRRTPRQRSLQLCAGAFCAVLAGVAIFHVGPRLRQVPFKFDTVSAGASGDTLFDPTQGAAQYPDGVPSWERWWNGPGGTFEPVTLDLAVTVAVGALLLESRRRRRRPPPGLVTVLVASTIYAHSATLAPTGWVGHAWFYLGFAFPVVMTVLIDARELNAAHPARGRRLVGTLGAILFLITVAGWNLVSAGLNPSKSLADSIFTFTRGLSLPFFLTALIAAVVAGAIEITPAEPAQPEGGAGIGVEQRAR